MAEHRAQGCLPSRVVSIASATEVLMEREKSIPVQAVVCKIIQCAPLRYSAQHRISSFWKVDLTPSNYTRAHFEGQVFLTGTVGAGSTTGRAMFFVPRSLCFVFGVSVPLGDASVAGRLCTA